MADAMETLKNILGDDAEDKIKNVMSSLSSSQSELPSASSIDVSGVNQLMQLKGIIESMTKNADDPRSRLLLALKPYMRPTRRQSIDSAVRLLGIANFARLLKM